MELIRLPDIKWKFCKDNCHHDIYGSFGSGKLECHAEAPCKIFLKKSSKSNQVRVDTGDTDHIGKLTGSRIGFSGAILTF